MLELILDSQFKWGTLSDWGQSDIGIDLGKSIPVGYLIRYYQFKWGTLSDLRQSDIGIDLGKSIPVGYSI